MKFSVEMTPEELLLIIILSAATFQLINQERPCPLTHHIRDRSSGGARRQ